MTPVSIVLISALLFAAGIISSVTGGGLGTMALLIQTFFLDIRTSVAITSLLIFINLLIKSATFWRQADLQIVFRYVVLGLPMTYIGGRLLFLLPDGVPEKGLGIVCLLFVASRLLKLTPRLPRGPVALVIAGALNGFFGGLFGNTGLILLPILFSMGFTTTELIATSSVIGMIMEFGKVGAYLPHIAFTPDILLLIVIAIPVITAGVTVGSRVLRHVSEELFEKLLLGIIVIGAARLLLFP